MEAPKREKENKNIDESNSETAPKRPKTHRKWWQVALRWLMWVSVGVVALILLLSVLLYVPAVQNWVVQTATRELKSSIGYDVEIGRIRIGFPLKLNIRNVKASDGETGEMVGKFDYLSAQVSLLPMIRGGVIPVSGIELKGVELNYSTPNDSLSLVGHLQEVEANFLNFDTNSSQLQVDFFRAENADVYITALSDTTQQQPPSEPSSLVVLINKAQVKNLAAKVAIRPDTFLINAKINEADIIGTEVNLLHQYYQAKEAKIDAWLGAVGADLDFMPMPWIAKVDGKGFRYGGAHDISGDIRQIYFEVGDGWRVEEAQLKAKKDSIGIVVEGLNLQLPDSRIQGRAIIPFDEWTPAKVGNVDIDFRGKVNPKEVIRFVGEMEGIPLETFDLSIIGKGAMEKVLNMDVNISNPDILALDLSATAGRLFDKPMGPLKAKYHITSYERLTPTLAKIASGGEDSIPSWRLPKGMVLHGQAEIEGDNIGSDFILDAPKGKLLGYVHYNTNRSAYEGRFNIQELNLHHFLPNDSIGIISGVVDLEGRGTDPFDEKMKAHLFVNIDSIQYAKKSLNEITLLSELKNGYLFGALNSSDEAVKLTAQIDARLRRNDIQGSVNLFVDTIIPREIGLSTPVIQGAKLELRSAIRTDLKEYYDFDGELENFWIQTDKKLIRPTNTYVAATTSDSLMYAEVTSGDLSLQVDIENGLKDFSNRINTLTKIIGEAFSDTISQVNMAPWLEYYPTMDLKLTMGRENLLRSYLDEHRIGAQSAYLNLRTTTDKGLSGDGAVSFFQLDTFRIDNMDLLLMQDSVFFYAFASVHKERFRNQQPFTIASSVTTNVQRSELFLNWMDHNEKDFLQLGLEMWSKPNGDLTLGFTPDPFILFYNQFETVGDDYITFPNNDRGKILADMTLKSAHGASIALKDEPSNDGHLFKVKLDRLRLSSLSGVRFIPDISGVIDADISWLQSDEGGHSFIAQLEAEDFHYQKEPFGDLNILAEASMNKEVGNFLTADLGIEGREVAQLTVYQPAGSDASQARFWARTNNLPLTPANPFLPERYVQLDGLLDGNLYNYDTSQDIRLAQTQEFSGMLQIKDGEVFVQAANETYRPASTPIYIREGVLLFDNYSLGSNNSALAINGQVQLAQPGYPVNLSLTGNDLHLLNSTQTAKTEIYGVINADANIRMQGPIQAFQLTGDVAIKGNTNVTYQSQESELRQRNNFKGLVEFTDFTDTLFVEKKTSVDSLSLSGHDIRLALHIDPAARFNALLSLTGEQSKVSIQGGGDFNLIIPPYGAMNLSGTYSVVDGDIALNVPPISRKFIINNGSRVVWSGPLLEPYIDFSATSRIRSQVSQGEEPSRSVEFDVTLYVENNLDNLALRFETKAPSDLAVQNALATLGPEEQNRQSIMLLTTGLYLGSGSGQSMKGFDMNSALSSLVASQFNSLAGEALDAEINVGVTNTSNTYGTGTDYTYSIAKRFYNDRINIVVGGRMMTGEAAAGLKQSFINNMSLEYRLDEAGTHYLRLFHRRNYENLLDGEVIETGVGYLIRRRLNRLQDLFNFRRRSTQQIIQIDENTEDYPEENNEQQNQTSANTTENEHE